MGRQAAALRAQELEARRQRKAEEIASRRQRRAARRERLALSMLMQRKIARDKVRQGAFLLPSLLTVGSVFLSFWAIIAIFNHGHAMLLSQGTSRAEVFSLASWLLFAAFLLDGLDGKVARLTGTSSEFGIQLDSLADVLSFGIAPALLAYSWALQPFGRIGWLVAFLFIICGACRLARFNVQTVAAPDKRYFTGLPIPVAALSIAALVMNFPDLQARSVLAWTTLVLVPVLSFLMVSRIRYRSFKDIDLRRARSPRTVALIALVLSIIIIEPQLMLLLIMGSIVFSGPLGSVLPPRWGGQARKPALAVGPNPERQDAEPPDETAAGPAEVPLLQASRPSGPAPAAFEPPAPDQSEER